MQFIERLRGFYRERRAQFDGAFYLLFAFCYLHRFAGSTMLPELFRSPLFYKLSYVAAIGLLSLLLLPELCAEEDGRFLAARAAIPLAGLLYWAQGGNPNIYGLCLLISLCAGKSARVLLGLSLSLGILTLGAAFWAAQNGYISYFVYENGGRALGSVYRTDFSAHVFYFLLAYRALKKKPFAWYHYGLLSFAALYVYHLTKARNSLICAAAFLAGCLLLDWLRPGDGSSVRGAEREERGELEYGLRGTDKEHRHMRAALFCGAYPVAAGLCFAAVFAFGNRIGGLPPFLETLSGRIALSRTAFSRYPLRLFGQAVSEQGNGGTERMLGEYFFLDCSYVRILIIYGLLIFVLAMGLCAWLLWRSRREKRPYLALALLMIAAHSVMEHHLTEYWYNIFLLLPFSVWDGLEGGERNAERRGNPRRMPALLAVPVFLLAGESFLFDQLDRRLLLERRNPVFFQYLSQGEVYSCAREDTGNLLRITAKSAEMNGISCTVNEDSSVTFSGRNTGERIYWSISSGNYLPDGQYFLSDGNASDAECFLYSEGWNTEGENKTLKYLQARLPEEPLVGADHEAYTGGHWFGVRIPAGAELNQLRFYPMLTKEPGVEYEPAWMAGELGRYKRYIASVPEGESVGESDLTLFQNMVRYRQPFCTSAEIDYTDGDGFVLKKELYSLLPVDG